MNRQSKLGNNKLILLELITNIHFEYFNLKLNSNLKQFNNILILLIQFPYQNHKF